MKFAATVSFLFLSSASAAPIPTCSDQWSCINFEASPTEDNCGRNGECAVEVCLHIDTAQEGCTKGGAGISHVCDGGDANGCPMSSSSGSLLLDSGDGFCPSVTGQGDGTTHKCSDISEIVMCQSGAPGDDLTFIIKDGLNADGDSWANNGDDTTCGTPVITCENAGILNCGGNQADMERRWTYTIPSDFCSSACAVKTSPPTLPPQPAPTAAPVAPPTEESTPVAPPTLAPTSSPTPAPTPACNPSVCETSGPNYHVGCGRSYCDTTSDSCLTEVHPGQTCSTTTPEGLNGNSCYTGPQCSLDGLSCNHVFKEKGSDCSIAGEDASSFDDVCVQDPVCTAVDNGITGYTECQRKIKEMAPCTLPSDYQSTSEPGGRGVCHAGDFCTSGGKCESVPLPSDHACRPSEACCDKAEYCPGTVDGGFECPEDTVKSEGVTCRPVCENCIGDEAEVCDGDSKFCPADIIFADELCIFAGQNQLVGSMALRIVKDNSGEFVMNMHSALSEALAEVSENVKWFLGTEAPPNNPGYYNLKYENVHSVSRSLSALDYDVCGADASQTSVYFAAHFDMASGETAWALPCESTKHLGETSSQFCSINKQGNPVCAGWGRFFAITPCCPETAGCGNTCGIIPGVPESSPTTSPVAAPTSSPPAPTIDSTPTATPKECTLGCGGNLIETLICPADHHATATCTSNNNSRNLLRARNF